MAEKSKRSQKKSERTTIFARVIWIVWTLVTGGSVAGWVAPDMPLVGPLMQSLLSSEQVTDALEKVPDTAWKDNLKKLRSDLTKSVAPTTGAATTLTAPAAISPTATSAATAQKPGDVIRIAIYNIQVFGTSKLAKTWVVDILAKVVRHFDIVAIQEVRAQGRHDSAQLRGGDQRGWQPL